MSIVTITSQKRITTGR